MRVADVELGDGNLAGTGVYARRDFAAGEVVVTYELELLTPHEYAALPIGEELFVHSYGGQRYLYPAPARFVNHSDDPSCFQDFERGCDVALRPIRAGEAITIDAREETARELETFIEALAAALSGRSAERLAGLLSETVVLWTQGHEYVGSAAVIEELLFLEILPFGRKEWLVGTGRWEALCSTSSGAGAAHLTILVKIVAGNWQIVYLHRD